MKGRIAAALVALALGEAAGAACNPVETRGPNGADQRPSREGQTRACEVRSEAGFEVKVLARGLEKPWSVEPLPGGDLLVTEKAGRIRIVSAAGEVGPPLTGVPAVDARGQGGLLDAALSPSFATDRTIYWSFSEPRQGGNGTSVALGVLSADGRGLEQVRVIFRAQPTYDVQAAAFDGEGRLWEVEHGTRDVREGPDGTLYIVTDQSNGELWKLIPRR